NNYSNVRYKLRISIEKNAPLMYGTVEAHVNITDEGAANDLVLDWRTTQFLNDKNKPYAKVLSVNAQKANAGKVLSIHQDEHLIIPKNLLKPGENTIEIEFASPVKTSGAATTRYIDKEDGGEYIYTLFVPSDASTAFPVFDQPDLKARFDLSLTIPAAWKPIANNPQSTVPIQNTNSKTYRFDETQPISTYVFAFAAGDFTEFTDDESAENPKTKIYVRKSQIEKFSPHSKDIFRLQKTSIKFYEEYFDFEFPFSKYDLVLIPEFPFGGMEHAGATFVRESSIIFPTEPTANNYISRAQLLFHENAHQWFGDTVTMKWFDDLWLKEGFATFMAYKAIDKLLPQYNAWKVFYERTKQAAYSTDVTKGTTPIYQEISNLSAAKSAYGNIVYQKAPSFLKQSEFFLGDEKFRAAVRSFLKSHQYSNAEWRDLVDSFEKASGKDVKEFADRWVTQKGLPIVTIKKSKLHVDSTNNDTRNAAEVFTFEQSDVLGENKSWLMKTRVLFELENGKTETRDAVISKNRLPVKEGFAQFWVLNPQRADVTQYVPKFVFPNYEDKAYGIFLLDEQGRRYITENIKNEQDGFLRSMMWGSLWDSVRFYELAPIEYINLAIKNIDVETDVSTIVSILGRVNTAFTYYLSDSQQKALAPKLESLLITQIKSSKDSGVRLTYYRAYLEIAHTKKAATILKQLLMGNATNIPALPLKTKDKFDIATHLIVLGDPDARKLLENLEKTETDDASKRYAYAAKAGFANAETKAKYWNDFVNNKEISESWIEAAFDVWNAPSQATLTLPYLKKALAELPNHKQNRKIFFVNGWTSSFIRGQKSQKALNVIDNFLKTNPNLDIDLKRKILENEDGLERAVKIKAKY
ncbi:MAG: M1 family aminopeptidase, partial [Pyrinomonadaceae bacterium]